MSPRRPGSRLAEPAPGRGFGPRVRHRRTGQNLTLQALAGSSGVSLSMLSQVERGVRVPTLPIALRIAEGLGCYLSELLDAPTELPYGVIHLDRVAGVADPQTGVRRVLLSRQLPASLVEVTWYRIPPGSHAGPFVHRDPTLQEQVTVVSGRLVIRLGHETHRLGMGDSLAFKGGVSHRFSNRGRQQCSFVHLAHPSRSQLTPARQPPRDAR